MNRKLLKKLLVAATFLSAWWGLILITYLAIIDLQNTRLDLRLSNLLSFFTIQSNILVAIVSTYALFYSKKKISKRFQLLQFGTLINITVTGLVYITVLSRVWNPGGYEFTANALLHYTTPILYILMWIFILKKSKLQNLIALQWLGYPVIYTIYTLLRGPSTGFYPYPFIDASVLSPGELLINAAGMTIFFVIIGLIFVQINNHLIKRSR